MVVDKLSLPHLPQFPTKLQIKSSFFDFIQFMSTLSVELKLPVMNANRTIYMFKGNKIKNYYDYYWVCSSCYV